MPDRVLHEVSHELAREHRFDVGERGRNIDRHPHPARGGLFGKTVGGVARKPREIDAFGMPRRRVDLRKLQQRARRFDAALVHGAQPLEQGELSLGTLLDPASALLDCEVEHRPAGREWGQQFVRGVRCEPTGSRECLLQLREHIVEILGQF